MTATSLDWISSAERLRAAGQPFALVSVVRVVAPSSARPGDKALVTADGRIDGWIGGGCSQPAVVRTVRQSLQDGQPRMIRIAPAAEGHERELSDLLEFGMACHSGGTVELFIDPVLPPAHLVVVGDSPVAVSLAELAPRVGLTVTVIAHDADASRFADARQVLVTDDAIAFAGEVEAGAFVVVATQGRRDLQGLHAALSLKARKIFFVASARKADVLRRTLLESEHDQAEVDAIVAPAGQAIGAQTPQEIALAVLAAVIAARRNAPEKEVVESPRAKPSVLPLPELAPIAGSCCGGGAAKE
ncbi:XdhC family protein [Paucibacter sp. R3-3]|uniref:XdhC family protein n=1 Tax=Roseateles agri TaxID=3098619 RepID=A0ABU5DLU4_9BURK|nr:XdhC family protein [Paucibacter sp. R3-3]MDY0747280.1 XdhC family protein [Paucibacter sp. R3-3]